jgi:hypothetical protein
VSAFREQLLVALVSSPQGLVAMKTTEGAAQLYEAVEALAGVACQRWGHVAGHAVFKDNGQQVWTPRGHCGRCGAEWKGT